MINNTAYIISEFVRLTGDAPVKKALQKTVFLLEHKGVSLGYDYILHFYGPYCAELDRETQRLSVDGVIDIEYRQYGHKLWPADLPDCPIDTDLPADQRRTIENVITRYRDRGPSDLELLTTAIYAYEHTGARTRSQVRSNVKKIKGEKYSDAEITWALNEFSYFKIALEM